jgi:hypothetical protein
MATDRHGLAQTLLLGFGIVRPFDGEWALLYIARRPWFVRARVGVVFAEEGVGAGVILGIFLGEGGRKGGSLCARREWDFCEGRKSLGTVVLRVMGLWWEGV